MIILSDEEIDIICADDDEKIFLAYYKNVKEELGDVKGAWNGRKPDDIDIVIFKSLNRAEEKIRYISNEGYGNEGNYAEVRHICVVNVFQKDGSHQPLASDIPAEEQLQEIMKEYEERGFELPPKLYAPRLEPGNGTKPHPLIVVLSTLESMGEDEEYEEEDEE